ncbi:MAG: macro domain-containing protein [Thermoanaerobaculia bacterium]
MKVSIFIGDIADVEADALCTSTNPRLSLVMGTGAAVRERGGLEVLRACEQIVREHGGAPLPAGTAYATTAGSLPHKVVIHCVASDTAHRSSDAIVDSCVTAALRCADDHGCGSVAMPAFATGHAHAPFARSVGVMAKTLRLARTSVKDVTLVVLDADRARIAQEILERDLEGPVAVAAAPSDDVAPASYWLSDEDDERW